MVDVGLDSVYHTNLYLANVNLKPKGCPLDSVSCTIKDPGRYTFINGKETFSHLTRCYVSTI